MLKYGRRARLEVGYCPADANSPGSVLNVCNGQDFIHRGQGQRLRGGTRQLQCLTGYTCGDLFQQPALLQSAASALEHLAQQGKDVFRGLTMVGLPLVVQDQLYNCAAVFQDGKILGVVPKTYLPNTREFYEGRWFAPGSRLMQLQ